MALLCLFPFKILKKVVVTKCIRKITMKSGLNWIVNVSMNDKNVCTFGYFTAVSKSLPVSPKFVLSHDSPHRIQEIPMSRMWQPIHLYFQLASPQKSPSRNLWSFTIGFKTCSQIGLLKGKAVGGQKSRKRPLNLNCGFKLY